MPAIVNRGRLINTIPGIQGVAAGGTATINLPTNFRYHRLKLYYTENGVATAIGTGLTSLKIAVNGVVMRDISPADTVRIAQANGYAAATGELPIYFTSPWRNVNVANEATSWDLFGQGTFQMQVGIRAAANAPALVGLMEFDSLRNTVDQGNGPVPFLQPVAQHTFTFNVPSGTTQINTIPFNYPINRIWLNGSTQGHILGVELYQDGNKVLESASGSTDANNVAGLYRMLTDYGFVLNTPGNVNAATFDAAFISDPDQRWLKSLSVANSLVLKVTTDLQMTLSAVVETMPGAFQG